MSTKYFALLTQLGADKLANAAALGTKIEITHMAVGDGGGSLPVPDTKQTKLINEKRRAAINTLSIDPKNTNQIIAEQVIPETEGGWWIREIGLYDKDGVLVAVGNCAETYKPQLQEGSGRTQTIRMILIVSSANAVTLKVDPSIVLATREYVDNSITKHANSRNHPDATLKEKGFVILSSAVDSNSETYAATPKAVKAAYDLANAANNNANTRVPSVRKVNGKALSADISLNSADVGAYNKAETDARVNEAKVQAKVANDNANGRVPAARKVNGKTLSADISLNSADVGAYNKAETDARVNEAKAQANAASDNANTRLEKNKNGADIPNKDEFVKNLGFIEQKTGASTTSVISQKTATDSFARKDLYTEKPKVSVIKTPNKSASLEIGDEGWLALKNESTGDVKFTVDSSGNIKNGLVGIVAGGTGAKTAEQARVNLGLEETVKLAADAWSKSIVGSVGNGGTFASCKTPGIYSIGIEKPDSVSDFPKVNGSPIYSWGMMIVTRSQGCTSQFYMSHKGHMAVRQLWYPSKEYHEWFVQYSPENKPSATDIGALPITGGSLNGSISSSVMDNYRIEAGGYGVFLRLDGENFYILQTNKNNSKGSWNNFRPFSINMKTGKVLLDHETKINGNLLIGSTGTTIAQDGNIWGSRWGNKWLWDAVVELVNNRTNAMKNTAQKEPNGWWKCGDTGIIYQWGITNRTLGEDYLDVRFPLQFPSACVSGVATPKYDYNLGRLDGNFSAYFYILDKTRCRISLDQSSTDWKVPVYWFAIGY